MILTEQQQDSLAEVINIAFARTGASLSELTGQRVLLDVPQVSVHPIAELTDALIRLIRGETATVHQIFSGSVSGDALLLLSYDDAVMLVDLMTDEHLPTQRLNTSAREVLTEVGNILLNACLGVFGDLLQVHVSFSVPRLHLEQLRELLNSLVIGKEGLQYALLVHATFRLRESAVSGYFVLVLGVASLDQLMRAIEQLG
jgi:chemotaxis protein CheC